MQALHCKIDVVLVQIPPYNCIETDYSFCEDSQPSRTPPSTRMRVSPSDPFSPHYFFSLRRPCYRPTYGHINSAWYQCCINRDNGTDSLVSCVALLYLAQAPRDTSQPSLIISPCSPHNPPHARINGALKFAIVNLAPLGLRSYCNQYVRLSVCLSVSSHNSKTARPNFT